MVSPEDFEAARALMADAIAEAYDGLYLVPPVEVLPGEWAFWPTREIGLKLEETMWWSYGKPVGGTGNLQAHITWPYGNSERIKPRPARKKFDKKTAEAAARVAKVVSEQRAEHLGYNRVSVQEAYIAGYEAVEKASEDDLRRLWHVRRETYVTTRADWEKLHGGVKVFLKMKRDVKGAFEWMPGEDEPSPWDKFEGVVENDMLYSAASNGVLNALDDWAMAQGLLKVDKEGNYLV